jgi:exodeoxyribonuclease-3
VAILSRGDDPVESRRGLPGAQDDVQSRYLEARRTACIVGCLYLPNGNPQPVRSSTTSWPGSTLPAQRELFASGIRWCWPATTTWSPPTSSTSTTRNPGRRTRCCNPKAANAGGAARPGLDRCAAHAAPGGEDLHVLGLLPEPLAAQRWLRIDHLLLSDELAPRLRAADVDRWVRGPDGASDHAPTWVELDMGGKRAAAKPPKKAAKKNGEESAKKVAKGGEALTVIPAKRGMTGVHHLLQHQLPQQFFSQQRAHHAALAGGLIGFLEVHLGHLLLIGSIFSVMPSSIAMLG